MGPTNPNGICRPKYLTLRVNPTPLKPNDIQNQARLWLSKHGVDTKGGHNLPPLVAIGLMWLPKLGVDMSPCPQARLKIGFSHTFLMQLHNLFTSGWQFPCFINVCTSTSNFSDLWTALIKDITCSHPMTLAMQGLSQLWTILVYFAKTCVILQGCILDTGYFFHTSPIQCLIFLVIL